jgi:hypothetical protein
MTNTLAYSAIIREKKFCNIDPRRLQSLEQQAVLSYIVLFDNNDTLNVIQVPYVVIIS